MHVLEKILQNVASDPKKVAVMASDVNYTYMDIYSVAINLTQTLKKHGVVKGDKVLVLLSDRAKVPSCIFSIFLLEAVYVPIDQSWPKARIQLIIDQTDAKLLISENECKPQISQLHFLNIEFVDQLFKDTTEVSLDHISQLALPSAASQSVIFYTSGSTGIPKGVALSYQNIDYYVKSAKEQYSFSPIDSQLSVAKNTFSISLFDLLLPFYYGGTLYTLPLDKLMDSKHLANTIAQITSFHMGPALLDSLLNHARIENLCFKNITHVSMGGDIVPARLLDQLNDYFPNAEIWVIYGCTEIACMGTTWQFDPKRDKELSFVGQAFKDSIVQIINEYDEPVSKGEIGEICFSGPGVFAGYVNSSIPKDTYLKNIKGFDKNVFYATGDLGATQENGNIKIIGRKDFQIKVNGVRIEAAEVEHWAEQIDIVAKAVALGVKASQTDSDSKLVLFVKTKDANSKSFELQIKKQLKEMVPVYMVPNRVVCMDDFPLNSNGKLDRKALLAAAKSLLEETQIVVSDENEFAKRLSKIWLKSGVSGYIDENTNFFDVGGDSLGVVQLLHHIKQEFDIKYEFDYVYSNPVFKQQLKSLSQGGSIKSTVPTNMLVELDGKSKELERAVFVTPGLDGHIVSFHNFGTHFSTATKVFGLLYPNFNDESYQTIEEVAEKLANDILASKPEGTYYLVGHSSGGFVNLEIAKILRAKGKRVFLFMVEVRVYEKSPLKPIWTRLKTYAKVKPKQFIEAFFESSKKFNKTQPFDHKARIKQRESLKLSELKGAFSLSKEQISRYIAPPTDIPAILVKAEKRIWWDALRQWPEDYGVTEYVNLLDTIYSKGDHVSIVMDNRHHQYLAKSIETCMNDEKYKLS